MRDKITNVILAERGPEALLASRRQGAPLSWSGSELDRRFDSQSAAGARCFGFNTLPYEGCNDPQ